MNVKSKILKTRNLPKDGKKLDSIGTKPYLIIILGIVLGIILLFTRFYLFGIVLVILFLYYLLFVKNVVLIEFYDQYVVFYLNNGNEECFILFWNDILKWHICESRNDLDELHVILKNKKHVDLKCLGKKKIRHWFSQFVDDEKITKELHEQHI